MVDIQYFLNPILAVVHPLTAAFVILAITLIRYVLPTPEGGTVLAVTPKLHRYLLPILPYPLGILGYMLLRDHSIATPFHDICIKGFFSGGLADIAYRKFKVMILGS